MKPKIVYQQLKQILEKIGYTAESVTLDISGRDVQSIVFRHPGSEMYIILPFMKPDTLVQPIHLRRVKDALEDSGFWDSLVRQTKTENPDEAVQVLQKLAGIESVQ